MEAEALKPVTLGQPFELHLEIHHILLARSVAGCAGIESQSPGLIKIPFRFLTIRKGYPSADHCTWSCDLVDRHGNFSGRGGFLRFGSRQWRRFARTLLFLDGEFKVVGKKTSLQVGQRDLKLLLQALLDLGKSCTRFDPLGDGSFLVVGKAHRVDLVSTKSTKDAKKLEAYFDVHAMARGTIRRRSRGQC